MKRRLRTISITLEESVLRWARVQAAKREISVSQFVGEHLREHMCNDDDYKQAMLRALERKPFLKTDGRYLTRERTHERSD